MTWMRRVTVLATAAGLAVVAFGVSGTLSGFSSASVSNTVNNLGSAQLAISHAYGSTCSATLQATATTTSCPGSLYPSSSTSGGAPQSDVITNTGTVAATGSYRVLGCGPVNLANTGSSKSSGDMLPRTGTTFDPANGPFSGSGSITLNGTTGYASAVTATIEPTGPAVIGSATYGLGIWFKAGASSTPGPLFGFGSNALDTAGTNDRILSLTASGAISFTASPNGTPLTSSTATYRDNTWHFAHVLISTSRIVVGLNYTLSLSVDGTQVATANSGLLGSLSAYLGYWHLGWSPVGGTGRYFAGSLSGFVVDDGPNATAPSTKPTAYASGNELWKLNDAGGGVSGSTVTGVLPAATALPGGAAEPCTAVSIAWPLVSTSSTLRAAVIAGAKTAAAPTPTGAQTSTITLTTNASAPAYDKGLLLYAPIQADYTAGSSGSWLVSFVWSTSAVAGTVVIA